MTTTPAEMTEDQWAETYKPKDAPVQGSGFGFGGGDTLIDGHRPEEIAALMAADEKCVWTVIDGDDDGTYIVSGRHLVNRIGHIITEVPFEGDFLEVRLDDVD